MPVVGSNTQVCKGFGNVDVVVIHVDTVVVERVPIDILIGYWNALLEFGHVVKGGGWVGHVSIEFNEQVLDVRMEDHGEPKDTNLWPGPGLVNETPFTNGFRVMVPLVGDSTGLGIERVFGRFLKVTKLEGVGIPVQFSGVLFNFHEEQQRVPFGSELQLVILADEQFDGLGDDASIGHNPIGTLNGCHSLL